PFYGGTYFPVSPRYGRPGFLDSLKAIRRFYDVEKEKLQEVTGEIVTQLENSALLPVVEDPLPETLLLRGVEVATSILDNRGQGPSFPMMPYAGLALRGDRFSYSSRYDGAQVCFRRGQNLALGGIYDHVGGGFHRYTVDGTWTVPHFEKMLYDNGQILEYLADLWSCGWQEPAFARAIAGTVQWLQREMTAPEGYFYASQDADNFATPSAAEPEEGLFYVWSFSELEMLLDREELQTLQAEFSVSPEGNFEGQTVLQRNELGELSAATLSALDKLFTARYGSEPEVFADTTFPPAVDANAAKTGDWPGRIPPVTDPKLIVAWNSLVISGLARAAAALGEPNYRELAIQAADFIWEHQRRGDRLLRLNYQGTPAQAAQAEDYALLIKAFLDLQASAPADPRAEDWIARALQLQAEFDLDFWDAAGSGGYFNAASDAGQDLLVRERSYIDNATPAANGVAAANLVRLHLLTEQLAFLNRAEALLKALAGPMQSTPQACPSLFVALDWYRNAVLARADRSFLTDLVRQYFPTCNPRLEVALPDGAAALVCRGLACLPAKSDREGAFAQIRQAQVRAY
ncbi:MAG: thioredoxin domain-containing protein, partial [Cyanobacteria bacterium J06641_5]